MTAQNVTDIMLLGGAVAFGAWGIYRGAIRQIGWIVAFLCAFFVARTFGAQCASFLNISLIITYILLFILAFVLVTLIFRALRFTAHLLLMGPIDRTAGLIVGLFKWIFLASLVLNILYMCNPRWPIFASATASWTIRFVPRLFGAATGYLS